MAREFQRGHQMPGCSDRTAGTDLYVGVLISTVGADLRHQLDFGLDADERALSPTIRTIIFY
ncbi:hypothetical protein GCM10023238_38910 [Streptomyces heliomycini]